MIDAKLIAYSLSPSGKRLATFEITYPRFILAELNTHKMLEKNSASSRAIPIEKMIETVRNNPAMPVHWGKNQAGMQAKEELEGDNLSVVQERWRIAMNNACYESQIMDAWGAHKQIANRITEPFQWMKTVITGTEWRNFFHLRAHEDAQPEFKVLAQKMQELYEGELPKELRAGDWHVPYYKEGIWTPEDTDHTLEEALMISSSCCAQTSFRSSDDSLEKAKRIYDRLVESKPVHASPFGHQATPIVSETITTTDDDLETVIVSEKNIISKPWTWEDGVTAYHKKLGLMSGNLAGYIQYRQLIPESCVW